MQFVCLSFPPCFPSSLPPVNLFFLLHKFPSVSGIDLLLVQEIPSREQPL